MYLFGGVGDADAGTFDALDRLKTMCGICGYFNWDNRDALDRMLRRNFSDQIFALLVLELWLRHFEEKA